MEDDERHLIYPKGQYYEDKKDDWCPVCGETFAECECTDRDFTEAWGEY